MWLAIEMKVLEMQVKMQVWMLIFHQKMNKGTDIYNRGHVHEGNAGRVKGASVFGLVFTYSRKKKNRRETGRLFPLLE